MRMINIQHGSILKVHCDVLRSLTYINLFCKDDLHRKVSEKLN